MSHWILIFISVCTL